MRVHRNAKTTPKARALIVQRVEREGWSVPETADALGVSERTVYKWRARYHGEGVSGLQDRSAAPHRIPHRTSAAREARIVALRTQRLAGWMIARRLQLPRATVGAVLRRRGLGRLPAVTAAAPVRRYEREHPGELLHLDIKSLGRIGVVGHRIHGDRRQYVRGVGWEHVHVCVDDASRVAYVEVLPTLTQADALGFLERAVAWFAGHGVPAHAYSPTTARHIARRRLPRPARASVSVTHSPNPIGHAPMAKPSASSKPCSASGPMSPIRHLRASPARVGPVGALLQPQTSAHGAQLSGADHQAPRGRGVNNLPSHNS